MPCSSTHCPGRPPHTLPQSAGRACAGRVPCWLWVACASWLMQVACTPAPCPGCFTLHCDRAIVLGSSHHGFVGGSFPCLAHHSFPQCASGATAVANWVLDPLGAGEQRRCAAGAPGLVPWVPDPLRALVVPQNASGAPVVAHWVLGPLGTCRHRLCAAGAPELALWVPHPL